MPSAGSRLYCRLSVGEDGPVLRGATTAAFGYAYAGALDFGGDEADGYNPGLTAYLADVSGAGALAERLAPLSGIFGGWHFDGHALHVFADQLGQRPVYVRQGDGFVAVAPRLAPLLSLGGLSPKPDTAQRRFFRQHGYYGGSGTAYVGIHRIWGGQVYSVGGDLGFRESAYVDWGFVGRDERVPEAALQARTWTILRDAMRRYAGHAEALTVPLSGGLDSRMLAAAAVEAGAPVRTFNFGDAESSDVRVGQRAAAALQLPFRHYGYDYGAWLTEARANVADAEGLLSCAHLVPPRPAMAALGPDTCIISGAAGNTTLGGDGEDYVPERLPPSAAAAGHYGFPLPGSILDVDDAAYRRELLRHVLRTRRLISACCLSAEHGRYRMPFLEWGLLRFLYGQPHGLRSGRAFQRALGLRYLPAPLLAIPLAQDGLRLGQSRYTPGRIVESLRYRAAKALGRELNPGFFDVAAVWRLHGEAIRNEVTAWAKREGIDDDLPAPGAPVTEWLHLLTLAFRAAA